MLRNRCFTTESHEWDRWMERVLPDMKLKTRRCQRCGETENYVLEMGKNEFRDRSEFNFSDL